MEIDFSSIPEIADMIGWDAGILPIEDVEFSDSDSDSDDLSSSSDSDDDSSNSDDSSSDQSSSYDDTFEETLSKQNEAWSNISSEGMLLLFGLDFFLVAEDLLVLFCVSFLFLPQL